MSLREDILNLFGLQIKKEESKKSLSGQLSLGIDDEGSSTAINSASLAGAFGTYLDTDGQIKTEIEAIKKYREISLFAEVDVAIQEIVNEAIPQEQDAKMITLNLDESDLSGAIKEEIQEEFKRVLQLLGYESRGSELFKRWYIDGKLPHQVIVNKDKLTDGIQKLVLLDAMYIKKVREVSTKKTPEGATVVENIDEYYLYNDSGFGAAKQVGVGNAGSTFGLKISADAIINPTSGIVDGNTGMLLSHLHKAVRPINQLRMLEDATVIYFIARAPERKAFYVDVGNLPKLKAEQYMKDMMNRFRNKMVYDSKTGDVKNDKKYMCLAMDTKVPLLDGRTLTIAEISTEYEAGKQLWAYSCDPDTGAFAPGLITWAGTTRKNAEVIKLILDNGESIICTPDHKFPVWNKGFVEAKNIVEGESMIPHYTKQEVIQGKNKATKLPYIQLFENDIKKWTYVHRLVSKWKDAVGIDNEFIFNEEFSNETKRTVHHKNFNKDNNTPENLIRMNAADHTKYHSDSIPFEVVNHLGLDQWGQYKNALQHRNHKIVKIEYLEDRIDTGCLTIDGDEKYHSHHTFALSAGIYTRNSMLEDLWLPRREGCFSLNTKIKLLDGRDVELGQLIVEHKTGKQNWVYSVSPTGEVVPGMISWAGVTRTDTDVIDVYLDNGEVITCTPDHKFILRNGEKIEARLLQANTSLMPLYSEKKIFYGNKKYEYILQNNTNKWKLTHSMVVDYIQRPRTGKEAVHHVNINRFDNSPENLVIMDKKEHLNLHTTMGISSWEFSDYDEHCKNISISRKKFYTTAEGMICKEQQRQRNIDNDAWKWLESGREKQKQMRDTDKLLLSHEEYLRKWSPGLEKMGTCGTRASAQRRIEDKTNLSIEEYNDKWGKGTDTITRQYNEKLASYDLSKIKNVIPDRPNIKNPEIISYVSSVYPDLTLGKFRKILKFNGYKHISDFLIRNFTEVGDKRTGHTSVMNHRVTQVVIRSDKIDVGTLTIDEDHKYHDYHNFALSSGVFVMNSKGTEIVPLPGASNITGYLDSLTWFKEKMYEALDIPKSRLQQESGFSLGQSQTISRDEVKFQKFIDRLRNKFGQLLLLSLKTQLILKGICNTEEWEEIKLDLKLDFQKDNYFSELKNQEILTSRFTMLQQADNYLQKYISKEWAQKNILMMQDEEIEEIETQMAAEANDETCWPDWKLQGQVQADMQQEMMAQQPQPAIPGQEDEEAKTSGPASPEDEYNPKNYKSK